MAHPLEGSTGTGTAPAGWDMRHRYAPTSVAVFDGRNAIKHAQVVGSAAYQPGGHPDKCPIRPELVAVALHTASVTRWYGCVRAYINSELRMVLVGCDPRDEVRMSWAPVTRKRQA